MYEKWEIKDIRKVLDEIGNRFELSCEDVPIRISSKMTRSLGCFTCLRSNSTYIYKAKEFAFSNQICEGIFPENDVRGIIIHEYIHFFLTIKFQERFGHNKTFKAYCVKAGISPDTTYDLDKSNKIKTKEEVFAVRCSCCNELVLVRKKSSKIINNITKYRSKCCKADLYYNIENILL